MARWRIQLFGRERLTGPGGASIAMPDAWWSILACLLVAPDRRMSRSQLAGRLWPDKDEQSARHCLASGLWRIRKRTHEVSDPLAATPETVSLSLDNLWIDALAFEHRVRAVLAEPGLLSRANQRRRLAHVLSHYRGDLLVERDAEWIAVERERLRIVYLDALLLLCRAEGDAGNWEGARAAAHTLCNAEPLREDGQRMLMLAHARCGARGLALDHYRRYAALLQAELGIGPMAETRRLAAELAGSAEASERLEHSFAGNTETALRHVRRNLGASLRIIDAVLENPKFVTEMPL